MSLLLQFLVVFSFFENNYLLLLQATSVRAFLILRQTPPPDKTPWTNPPPPWTKHSWTKPPRTKPSGQKLPDKTPLDKTSRTKPP